jgi:hypothetical protein
MAFTVEHLRPADPALATEYDHFMRMLPALRESHLGEYVAICDGEVIAVNDFASTVYADGRTRAAGRPVYVGFIDPPDYVVHIGGFTVLEGGE